MRWTADQLIDLSGKRALVTGGNSGLGAVVARDLARVGADVIVAARNTDAADEVVGEIRAAGGRAAAAHLDLASLGAVKEFAATIDGPLDLIVNNAGVMAPPRHTTTVDGHELQFGTNHLGHFALTALLLPRLLASPHPRVVTVASIAHHRGDSLVTEGNPPRGYRPNTAYGRSKLANLLFALELARRAEAARSPLVSAAAHPGVSNTSLFTRREGMGANWLVRTAGPLVMGLAAASPEQGAEAILYAATVAEAGSYTGPTGPGESRGAIGTARRSPQAQDLDLAFRLWERSEELTGIPFSFAGFPTAQVPQ